MSSLTSSWSTADWHRVQLYKRPSRTHRKANARHRRLCSKIRKTSRGYELATRSRFFWTFTKTSPLPIGRNVMSLFVAAVFEVVSVVTRNATVCSHFGRPKAYKPEIKDNITTSLHATSPKPSSTDQNCPIPSPHRNSSTLIIAWAQYLLQKAMNQHKHLDPYAAFDRAPPRGL